MGGYKDQNPDVQRAIEISAQYPCPQSQKTGGHQESQFYQSSQFNQQIHQNGFENLQESDKINQDYTTGWSSENQNSFTNYPIQQDPRPQIILRKLPQDTKVYTQKIHIRYLKPPPPPIHGPLIIKEIRPIQPPPPPPLVIRQRAPKQWKKKTIVLREKPPLPPRVESSRVIIKRLPALPPPPRRLIIERYPASPAPPAEIFVEKWLPYDKPPKRKVIYQKSQEAISAQVGRNLIICYEAPLPQYKREVIKLGTTITEPRLYEQQYGSTLLEQSQMQQHLQRHGIQQYVRTTEESYSTQSTKFEAASNLVGFDDINANAGGYDTNQIQNSGMIFPVNEQTPDYNAYQNNVQEIGNTFDQSNWQNGPYENSFNQIDTSLNQSEYNGSVGQTNSSFMYGAMDQGIVPNGGVDSMPIGSISQEPFIHESFDYSNGTTIPITSTDQIPQPSILPNVSTEYQLDNTQSNYLQSNSSYVDNIPDMGCSPRDYADPKQDL